MVHSSSALACGITHSWRYACRINSYQSKHKLFLCFCMTASYTLPLWSIINRDCKTIGIYYSQEDFLILKTYDAGSWKPLSIYFTQLDILLHSLLSHYILFISGSNFHFFISSASQLEEFQYTYTQSPSRIITHQHSYTTSRETAPS